ncbi:MAG: carboxy-terminal protease [Candidatus Izimaplasma bacterium HR2]|nr:MAG: carboxy-terminal protease [Candidatus Izimaplasma bacterium HR2]
MSKKRINILLILFLVFMHAGCQTNLDNDECSGDQILINGICTSDEEQALIHLEHQKLLESDIEMIDLPEVIESLHESQSLSLPLSGENGTSFTWSSSHPGIISEDGFIFNPSFKSPPIDVTITVLAKNGTYSNNYDYVITVLPNEEVIVTSLEQVFFTNCEESVDIPNIQILDIYFVDNGTIPYVDYETFVSVIDNAIYYNVTDISYPSEDKIKVVYDPILSASILGNPGILEGDSRYTQSMTIDFANDTITLSSFLFLMKQAVVSNEIFSEDLFISDTILDEGDEVIIPFGDYNIDFTTYGDGENTKYLMPLYVISFLSSYMGGYYFNYNGEGIYGSRNGSCLGENIGVSNTNGEDVPYDARLASYNFFIVSLEYFSAHKQYRGINSYEDLLKKYRQELMTSETEDYYLTLTYMVNALNDAHAHYAYTGYYSETPLTPIFPNDEDMNLHRVYIAAHMLSLYTQYEEKYGASGRPQVRYIEDNIAVIVVNVFTDDTTNTLKTNLDSLPTSVDTVVIDLTTNGGGSLNSVLEILGLMTNEPIIFHSYVGVDDTSLTYEIVLDEIIYDYDWYFLVSNGSYSAATIASAIAKENDIATIIGQNTAGGSTGRLPIIFPCGFTYSMPMYNTFVFGEGNWEDGYNLFSIEAGVVADIHIKNLLNDAEILYIINQESR